jgi:hypothetical protein
MKLSIKKKNKIQGLVKKALDHYLQKQVIGESDIQYFTQRICDVVTETDNRSFPELKLYWCLMKWLESNTPEYICRLMDTEYISSVAWHEIMKSKLEITSIAFNNLQQDEFHEYFTQVVEWVSSYIVKCRPDDLIQQIRNV